MNRLMTLNRLYHFSTIDYFIRIKFAIKLFRETKKGVNNHLRKNAMNGRIALAKNFQLFLLYHVFIHVDCALLTSHKLVFAFLLALNQHVQDGNIQQDDVNTYLSLGLIFDYLKVESMYMREENTH